MSLWILDIGILEIIPKVKVNPDQSLNNDVG